MKYFIAVMIFLVLIIAVSLIPKTHSPILETKYNQDGYWAEVFKDGVRIWGAKKCMTPQESLNSIELHCQ